MSTAIAIFSNGSNLVSKSTGKSLGQRLAFAGSKTATELKADFRKAGLKGKELVKKVNACLSGEADSRWVRHEAAVSSLRSAGYIPDYVDAKKSGATVRFTKPGAAVTKVQVTKESVAAMTQEERDAVIALLLGEEEAKPVTIEA